MNLPRNSREYVRWPIRTGPADGTYEVTFDDGTTWLAAEVVDSEVRVLVAGPDVDQGPAAIQLDTGRTYVSVRLADNPEIVVRGAGTIDVK